MPEAVVRGKVKVTDITRQFYDNGASARIKLHCQYDPNIPEDRKFAKATPSGAIELHVDNPAAIEHFKLGQDFYIDFIPVEPEVK